MSAPFGRENRVLEIAAEIRRLLAELEHEAAASIVEQAGAHDARPFAIPHATHAFAPPTQGAFCCDVGVDRPNP